MALEKRLRRVKHKPMTKLHISTIPGFLFLLFALAGLSACSTGPLKGAFTKPAEPSAGLLSPNGKTMFFDWAVTGTSQIWKMIEPMGFPIQMTTGLRKPKF